MSKSNYYRERVILLLLFFAFMLPIDTLAQNIQLNGTVTDVSGESVIGASVLEKGTTNGVITDIDGNFTLSVSPKATIIISYVGYAPQEIALNGRKELKVVLKEDTELLDEVVVIGYGTQKKSDVSGSVSSVSGDKLNNIPTANAETALQGMAPGLIVNFGSGAAGSTPSLQVRGVTTYGTDNSPLVIIDGVPGDMSFLNPEDIKSMSVLKDAATAAIYGARAAAGVILIETYRGAKSKPKITFSAYWGVDQIAKNLMSVMPKNLSTWQRWRVQTPVKTPKIGLLTLQLMSKTPHSLATPIGRTNTTAMASHRNTMWGTPAAVRMPT